MIRKALAHMPAVRRRLGRERALAPHTVRNRRNKARIRKLWVNASISIWYPFKK